MHTPTPGRHRRVLTLVAGGALTLGASVAHAQRTREASIGVGRSALHASGSGAPCGGDEESPGGALAAEVRVGVVSPARWRWWGVDAGLARSGAAFPVGDRREGRVRLLSAQSMGWIGVGQRAAHWAPFAAIGTGAVWRMSRRYTEALLPCQAGTTCTDRPPAIRPIPTRLGDVQVAGALGVQHGRHRARIALEGRQGLFTTFLPGRVGPYYRMSVLQLTYTRGW